MLNPAVFLATIWAVLFAVSPFSSLEFYPFTDRFYWYVATAVGTFAFFSIFSSVALIHLFPVRAYAAMRNTFALHRNVVGIYIVAMLIALAANAYNHAAIVGASWWTPEQITMYRFLVFEEDEVVPLRWVSYLNFFFFSAIPVLICVRSRPWQRKLIYLMIAFFVYLGAARASIFTLALIAFFFDWQAHGFRWKLTASVGALLLAAYYGIGLIVGKDSSETDTFALANYALGPAHVLDQILNGVRLDSYGRYYTFLVLHGPLQAWDFIGEQTPILPFYETPYVMNVYTIFGPYVLDYGIEGSIAAMAVLGTICGFIHRAAVILKDPYLRFLLSLVLAMLTLGVFHDHFTTSGYVWASIFLGFFFFPVASARAANFTPQRHRAVVDQPQNT